MLFLSLSLLLLLVLLLPPSSPLSLPLGSRVCIFGGTGGVGQLVAGQLCSRGYRVRVVARDEGKARDALSPVQEQDMLEFESLDLLRATERELSAVMGGCEALLIATGTTAFPTVKWKGGNTPKEIDELATKRILDAIPLAAQGLSKVVLCTSIGTTRTKEMPFLILNLFKVLECKRAAEVALKAAALEKNAFSYAVVRPGRLVGGPYTALDLATLFKLEAKGAGAGVKVERGDGLVGDCSRNRLAGVIVGAICEKDCRNVEFSIIDDARGDAEVDWKGLVE